MDIEKAYIDSDEEGDIVTATVIPDSTVFDAQESRPERFKLFHDLCQFLSCKLEALDRLDGYNDEKR